jgi:hypothetical protein
MRALILSSALLASAAVAQAPSVQQRFDAARQKLEADDAAGALAELDALEAFLKTQPKPNPTNIAVTQAQRAEALVKLGRGVEAKVTARAALSGDALAKPALKPVRDNVRLTLAGIMEGELDHAAAAAEYLRIAAESDQPITRTVALMGAGRSRMFTDPAAALSYVDQALALAEANEAVGKKELANVLGLKGRILLNGGRDAEAKAALVRAVQLRGGLTQRVFLADVSLRADAAIAMLRLGQSEEARKYLAYAGAGRTEVQLQPPVESPLPPCGEGGLEPQDSAVIEFTILSDGRVVGARPIYSSRKGEAAYLFARTVERWSWDPENAAKVKPFFRLATRVELRCTNKAQRPPLTAEFESESAAWFAAKGVKPPAAVSDAARAIELRPRLGAAPANSAERLAVLLWLAQNGTIEGSDRLRFAEEAMKLAAQIEAPLSTRFLTALAHASAWAHENADTWRGRSVRLSQQLEQLRARPEFADAAVQAVLNLSLASAYGTQKREDEELAALKRVADAPGLPARHPLKVGALVQLANVHAARKEAEQAESLYALTGLTAKQCALVDGGPVLLRSGSGQFPMEAYGWGFEGWTSLEYDVAADGTTRNSRAVATFPPRVFAKASEDLARTVRYRVSYRPEGDLACTAMNRRVRFTISN